ncbi:hypothetical protein VB741_19320 [Leptothoe sp. PORK10 BA2]|nr:hypothetical protein [Leptothoe sp. PORK10 BA2]MEA5465885.1 hypothetical protein [Leptothoe sp. PORK10 BA2]
MKFERSSQGELIIMSPTGGESGRRNADITWEAARAMDGPCPPYRGFVCHP